MKNFFWSILFLIYAFSLTASDIAIVSLAIGQEYQANVQLGMQNKQAYCERHGYDFIYCPQSLDPSRHPAWSKILLLIQAFENPNYKWVVWMDADTLIMNQDIPLEDLIDEKYHLIIGRDFNEINSGVFFIRNCEWSIELLSRAYTHTEFLSHPWYEQLGLIAEMNKPEFASQVKIVPQRLFNAYPAETISSLMATYQPGDFLIHFASHHGGSLYPLFDKYCKLVINDRNLLTLDQYLGYYGFKLSPLHSNNNEGYMTRQQKEQFQAFLTQNSHIQSVLEIGLNGGHSANNFFQYCPSIHKFTSFDICMHAYTPIAVDYLSRKYKEKFEFIKGDSMVTIPKYVEDFPKQTFDLIYVDGNHSYEACTADIINCQKLARPDTILLIDDYVAWIKEAIDNLQSQGVIEIKNVHASHDPDGYRAWVEARYRFP